MTRISSALFFGFLVANLPAEVKPNADFADLIRTPAGIQRTLEQCDGNPRFEIDLANWLETAQPPAESDRRAVREISVRLLEDTTNVQLVLALTDGLLRHALEDVKRDPTTAPETLARSLYADIRRAIRNKPYKVSAVPVPAFGLAEDGTVTDDRTAKFLQEFLNLVAPRASYVVRPSERRPLYSADRAGRAQ